ncbi:AAA-ATPase At3g28580-like, partial [Triticum aestivum]|uniref:AAA-ATPase At3g28580-like n=1 Tax=Triticum aestivum TaxID=4565 RepID=UPI001D02684C
TNEKEAVIDDPKAFQESKEYYAKVGKAWNRGYLHYGPPDTTMISAMANFLDYDVYYLELKTVENNTKLRKLFIETTGKSIIVIGIDCFVNLTGKCRKDKNTASNKDSNNDDKPKLPVEPEKDDVTKVTLSCLLNFIEGLWSACGGERIIIFTTNHKEKLDSVLIRRGRVDKHIEMSYYRFEGFKRLLEETDMSPANVALAGNLMPMSKKKKRELDECLTCLIEVLK